MSLDAAYIDDTTRHIQLVRHFLERATDALTERGRLHDASKFDEPERSLFRDNMAKRDSVPFGTPAYREHLKRVKPALDHHYAVNRHHPEHHTSGISDMSLVDLLEMVCDWMSAAMKTHDGDVACVHRSIEANQERFGYSDEIRGILHHTVTALMVTSEGERVR